MEYNARNHQCLAPRVYRDLQTVGFAQTSRNGPVLRMPGVVTLVATHSRERVNTCSSRDANPFFHLVEAMAMLASANSVKLMAYLAKNMRSFSDDGERYNAFYGERLRVTWGDQLGQIIIELTTNPDSRQAVAQMWNPADLYRQTKDKACNLCLLFSVRPDGALDMTSINRSNDAIWGILSGANVVHLSFFQEYVACGLGRPVGTWTHVSNNLHVYTGNPQWELVRTAPPVDTYATSVEVSRPLFDKPAQRFDFDTQIRRFISGCELAARTGNADLVHSMHVDADVLPFIRDVAVPVFMAWHTRKAGLPTDVTQEWAHRILAPDWHLACCLWLMRRAGGAS